MYACLRAGAGRCRHASLCGGRRAHARQRACTLRHRRAIVRARAPEHDLILFARAHMRTRTCARVGGGTANLPQCPGQPILGSGMGARARVPAGLRRSPLRRPGTFCAPLLHCPEAAVLFPAASSLHRVALRTHMYMHMHVDMQMQMHIHRHVHIHMHVDMHIYIEHVRAHSTYTSCVRVCTYSIHAPTHPPSCTHMQLLPTPAAAVWPWNQGAGTHSQKCSLHALYIANALGQ